EAKAESPRTATEEQLLHMLQALLIERFQLKFHRENIQQSGFALAVGRKGSKLQKSTSEESGMVSAGGKPSRGRPISITFRKCTMASLATMLSNVGPGPVVDKTALPGEYDFTLSWDERDGPSLFSAVDEQLGLRLEAQKVQVSMFVVDSAQKPS